MTLTQARLKELLHYDPETGQFLRLIAPGKRNDLIGTIAGSPSTQGYILINVDNRKYRASRLAWLYMTGHWPKAFIDHRNTIKDDNRWLNLREATKAQNEQNKPRSVVNTSGIKGVYWNKAAKKWQAYIKQDGKAKYLGIFERIEDAAAARRTAELTVFGVYAYGFDVGSVMAG